MLYYVIYMLIDSLNLIILFIALSMAVVLALRTKERLRKVFVYISSALVFLVFNEIFQILSCLFIIPSHCILKYVIHVCFAVSLLLTLRLMSKICRR